MQLLRMTAPVICQSLASLLNFSVENGQVANDWKLARVTLVPKEGVTQRILATFVQCWYCQLLQRFLSK